MTIVDQPLRPGLLAAIFALVLATGCASPRPVVEVATGPVLEARQAEFLAALAGRDLDAVTGFFAADAELHVANMPPVKGRDAITQFYGNVFRFMVSAEYQPGRLEIAGSGDLAISTGSVTTVFEGRDGRMEFPGKFLLSWVLRDAEWRVLVYAISNDRDHRAASPR